MERVGSIANSAGNNLSPYRQMGSWDVGTADWRPSSFRQQLFLDNNYVIYIRKRAIINTLRNFVKMFYKKKKKISVEKANSMTMKTIFSGSA